MHIRIGVLAMVMLLSAACGGGPSGPVVSDTVADGLAAAEDGARWYEKGCYRRALYAYRVAHRHLAAADHQSGVALTMNSMGAVYRALGDPQTAQVFFEDAADGYHAQGDKIGWRQARVNHAAALIDVGDLIAGIRVLDAVDAAGMPPFPPALTNRSIALMRQGRMVDAEAFLKQAIALTEKAQSPAAATAHATMGRLMMATGRPEQAEGHFDAAFQLDRMAEFYIGMADDLEALADLALLRNAADKAVGFLKRSYALNALMQRQVATDRTLVKLNVAAESAGMDITAVVGVVSGWETDAAFEGPCDRP